MSEVNRANSNIFVQVFRVQSQNSDFSTSTYLSANLLHGQVVELFAGRLLTVASHVGQLHLFSTASVSQFSEILKMSEKAGHNLISS